MLFGQGSAYKMDAGRPIGEDAAHHVASAADLPVQTFLGTARQRLDRADGASQPDTFIRDANTGL